MDDQTGEQMRPELTMPPAEAEALRTAYEEARVILEYGSGGSTVLASELPGKHVTSIESDRAWARMMKAWLAANPPAEGTEVNIVWTDIGPTGDWGHPVSDSKWRSYPEYPLAVWRADGFHHPDVVLVDGRFRVGCALATAFSITRPVTLLFDDYSQRRWQHQVEEFLGAPLMIGRMAAFQVEPQPIPPAALLRVIRTMTSP
ncbi:hypothetical protein [Ruegeria pomeroyi]